MAERKAREAAAATADRAAAEEERVAAVEERAAAANERHICHTHTECIVELARCYVIVYQSWKRRTWIFKIQCWDFMSFYRKLGKAHAAGAVSHERTTGQPGSVMHSNTTPGVYTRVLHLN
jgi:hypothetical protein